MALRRSWWLLFGMLLYLAVLATTAHARSNPWDYWGRRPPLPWYVMAWSAERPVCRRILDALNGTDPGAGEFYDNAIFLKWKEDSDYLHAHWQGDQRLNAEDSAAWMDVPLFNDGHPAIVYKIRYVGAYSAPEYLYLFEEHSYFFSHEWYAGNVWEDKRVAAPLERFTYKPFASLPFMPRNPPSFDRLLNNGIYNETEVNLAEIDGKVFVVVRVPHDELFLVIQFLPDKTGHPVCIMGERARRK